MKNLFFSLLLCFSFIECAVPNGEAQKNIEKDYKAELHGLIVQYEKLEKYSRSHNRDQLFDLDALSLFGKFNDTLLKQKIGSIKELREVLIAKDLYPKNGLNLNGSEAIKSYEEQLSKSFWNLILDK